MSQSVFLNQFQKVMPPYSGKQADLVNWTSKCHQAVAMNTKDTLPQTIERIKKYFDRFGIKDTQIEKRYSECDDFLQPDFLKNKIYQINEQYPAGVGIFEKGQFFLEATDRIFAEIYRTQLHDQIENNPHVKRPDHLIHVTCTGYVSPSSVQKLVSHSAWQHATAITHAYHMGCYASLPAIRIADGLLAAQEDRINDFTVDLVHTELCGLHLNPLDHTPEQIVVQTLFADGHMKYTASNQKVAGSGSNLRLVCIHEKVIPDSENDMTWVPKSLGMGMTLSREVPEKIKAALKDFHTELCARSRITPAETANAVFAIHPGGPKIIDAVQEVLNLNDSQIVESRKILLARGNMSSATLPHVWQEVLNAQYPSGTFVMSYAFGPGLTLFGAVFEIQ